MRNILNEPLSLFFNIKNNELCLKFPQTIQKIQISSIERVFFEPIVEHEDYYMMVSYYQQ